MEFAIGVLVGVVVMTAVGYWLVQREWAERRQLSRQVDQLYRHLSCGAGMLGCKGGPRCSSDHK